MKKIFIVMLSLFLLASCQTTNLIDEENKLKIVTTIFPMTDLTQRVTGFEVIQLLPYGSADAHTWEPSPQEIILLEEADVFIYNGAGMEEWVEDVLATLGNKDLLIIEASKDVEKILSHDDHGIDPHTWSSPKTAKTQLLTISETLITFYPEYEDEFKSNTEKNSLLFDQLDKKYEEQLGTLTNRLMVVQHEAYGYLSRDYQLEQIGIEGLVPTSEPDPAKMVEIIELVKKYHVQTIFFEENVSDRVAQILAEETGAQTALLETLASQNSEKHDLIEMMESNLKTLMEGLQE